MKKRVLSLLLALSLVSGTVLAAETGGTIFRREKTYGGQFSDLPQDTVFYNNVSALYEYGLSVGNTDGTFGVSAPLTVGQAIIFAGRIRSIYRTGDPEAGAALYRAAGQRTAEPYLLYLRAEGIELDAALDERLPHAATRAEMAHILAGILPEELLPDIHAELVTEGYATRKAITDVTEYTPYQRDILSLYRKGVCIGSDDRGTFYPDAFITRGAAAAMLTRMIDPALRVTPNWSLTNAPEPAGRTLAALITGGQRVTAPVTDEEMDAAVRYMLSRDSNQLELSYPGEVTEQRVQQVMMQALTAVKRYCEQGYNSVECTYSPLGYVLLKFSATAAGESAAEYRAAAMEAALDVREQLWHEGYLREGMTEQEMAEVYYLWVCENTTYDYAAGDDSVSHLPYGLFENGTAVCDGYTGAYNLFLKLEGIDCTAISEGNHIWTSAVLDGVEYHIDTTWGDADDRVTYAYFAMTPEQSMLYHAK